MSNSFEWFFPKTYIRKYLKQLITQRLVIVLKFLWVLNSKFANPRILGGSLCDSWKPSFLSLVIFDWRTFSRWVAAPWWCQWAKNQALTYQNSRKRWCQVVFVNNIYIYIYILVYIYIYWYIYIYIYVWRRIHCVNVLHSKNKQKPQHFFDEFLYSFNTCLLRDSQRLQFIY